VVIRHVPDAGVGDPAGCRVGRCLMLVTGYAALGSMVTLCPRALSTCSVWRASEIIQCVVEEGRSVLSGGSGCGGPPGDFVPGTEAVGHLAAVFLGVEQVTTVPEVR
jgi:hypothetical protein